MSLLSKSEIQFLEGNKQVSRSCERKLKCMIRKKVEGQKKDIPLLSKLIPIEQLLDFDSLVAPSQTGSINESGGMVCSSRKPATEFSNSSMTNSLRATKFSKNQDFELDSSNLTKNSKTLVDHSNQSNPAKAHILENFTNNGSNSYNTRPRCYEMVEGFPKYYINNPSRLIETEVGSGGVEVINQSSRTFRLSISPSQGSFSLVDHQKTTIPGSNQFEIDHYRNLALKDLEYDIKSIEFSIKRSNFWNSFSNYLLEFNTQKTVYSRLSYAKRYYYLLISRNFRELHTMSNDKRIHIMKSLTSLSKYLGIYDKWKNIVTKFNLKWSSGFNGIEVFKRIIEPENTLDSMLSSLRSTLTNSDIPIGHRNILLYCTITGLRAAEAIESIKLIKNENTRLRYISNDNHMIKHYEFPEIFIRRTKKAYCSVINADLIELALSCPIVNVTAFRSYFTKRRIPLNMNYGRKIFATYLRNKGIEPEIIDLLQGRIGSSVFVNHYYRPDIKEIITKKIKPVLDELRKELIG